MMKKTILISLVLVLLMGTMGFADGVLMLEQSNIEDGAMDVSISPEFILDFSNNVVNMSVKDNNMQMFTLMNESSEEISVIVEMGDDQENRDIRNTIIIKTEQPLIEGSVYILNISKDLTSKNENKLEEDMQISFTTEGEKPGEVGTDSSTIFLMVVGALAVIVLVVVAKKRH
jgi:high-affinity nickel permease